MNTTSVDIADTAPAAARGPVIHPRWVRITHWINVVAMTVMIGSGWQIYNASPLLIINTENFDLVKGSDNYDILLEHIGRLPPGRHYFNPREL